jgi:hypothetical protein
MKKKVIPFTILALLIMLAAGFAMTSFARAATFLPASVSVTGPPTVTVGTVTTLPSGVMQFRDFGFEIPNLLMIGTNSYNTLSISTFGGQWNPHTGTVKWHFDVVWSVVGSPSNGFAGQAEITGLNYNPITDAVTWATVHCVAQGFGIFAGETLKLDLSASSSFLPWTGVCIVH